MSDCTDVNLVYGETRSLFVGVDRHYVESRRSDCAVALGLTIEPQSITLEPWSINDEPQNISVEPQSMVNEPLSIVADTQSMNAECLCIVAEAWSISTELTAIALGVVRTIALIAWNPNIFSGFVNVANFACDLHSCYTI